MPATPLSGSISFSDIRSLARDKIDYNPPTNVSVGRLAEVIRLYGQRGPGRSNIAFSNFYNSTIASFTVKISKYEITNESRKIGYTNYSSLRKRRPVYLKVPLGARREILTITLKPKINTFKKDSKNNNNYYIKTVLTGPLSNTKTTTLTDNSSTIPILALDDLGGVFDSLKAEGRYTLAVTDLVTNTLIKEVKFNISRGATNPFEIKV